jgi:DNA-binding transcriptional LysR family regulator
LELRHLRYLIAVAEAKSFVAAAVQLQVAQPALSRQIRDLETEIGVELVAREAGGSSMTPAGAAVIRAGRGILLSVRSAIARARLAEHGMAGRCVLSAGRDALSNGLVARIIQQVRAEYPGIELVIDDRELRPQWDALTECEVDIGIGTAPPDSHLHLAVETHSLDTLDSIIVGASHALATRTELELEDLRGESFIHYAPDIQCEPARVVEAELQARGFVPATIRRASTEDGVRMLVRSGAGWALIPGSIRDSLPRDIVAIRLRDLSVAFRYVHIHRHSDERPIVRSVLGVIRRDAAAGGIGSALPGVPRGHPELPRDARAGLASRIELRHLRYFTAVIEHGTIGRAAEQLDITQPALSRQVRDLEEEVGASLLTRAARGVAPTLAGESLCNDALRILTAVEQVIPEAHRALRGATGSVVAGVASSPTAWDVITRAVTAYETTHPETLVTVEDAPTPSQALALREARLDIAIGLQFPSTVEPDQTLVRVPLVPDLLDAALLSADHPLAQRDAISLGELEMLPFLFMKRDFIPGFYDQVMSTMARASYQPCIDGTYDALPTVWALAAQGIGWGLGSSSQRDHLPSGVVAVRLLDFQVPWGCELTYRRGENRPDVLALVAGVRQAAEGIAAAKHGMPRNEVLAAGGSRR